MMVQGEPGHEMFILEQGVSQHLRLYPQIHDDRPPSLAAFTRTRFSGCAARRRRW
jgi:hypothetical protein